MRILGLLLGLAAVAAAQSRYADEFFEGELVAVRGNRITLRYDFGRPNQMQDFELKAPEGLFPEGGRPKAVIEQGRLKLEPNTALQHRAVTTGVVRVRAKLQVHLRRDCGLLLDTKTQFVLLDLFDYRFRRHGGPTLAAFVPKAPLKWREFGHAGPQLAARFFRMDRQAVIDYARRPGHQACRIETFFLQREEGDKLKPSPTARFGVWCGEGTFEIDELTLTLELDPAYLEQHKLKPIYAVDLALREAPEGKLIAQAKEKPLGPAAASALRELARRGPDGYEAMLKVVKSFVRKKSYAAIPAVRELGNGAEAERRELLIGIAKKERYPPDVRCAAMIGLARFYPENDKLLHKGLELKVNARRELFHALVERGLPDRYVNDALNDPLLAEEAHGIMTDRGNQPKHLGSLTRIWAREALSPAAARALMEEFAERPNWNLVVGLIKLLEDGDPQIARGAHLLLLTLSGKDLPRDADLWRSWMTAKKTSYEPPPLSSPGAATAAIYRGVEFLAKELLDDGACTWAGADPKWMPYRVGATALAVYALRAAGVKRDHPAIVAAMQKTLLPNKALPSGLDGRTYTFSLLSLALYSVGGNEYKDQLAVLAKRLMQGQLDNGQWTYKCHDLTYARRPRAGDNSNTQYAILGLRAARLAGVQIDPRVWQRNAGFWMNSKNRWGGWGYGPRGSTDHELSMTAAGVATYAICMEALYGVEAVRRVRNSKRVKLGMNRLGEILLIKGFQGAELYAIYGIERACILTGTKAFNDFDWYHVGASNLVQTQKETGAWGVEGARGVATGHGYGEAIDTAYALLFLKRATTGLPGADGGGVIEVRVRKGSVK